MGKNNRRESVGTNRRPSKKSNRQLSSSERNKVEEAKFRELVGRNIKTIHDGDKVFGKEEITEQWENGELGRSLEHAEVADETQFNQTLWVEDPIDVSPTNEVSEDVVEVTQTVKPKRKKKQSKPKKEHNECQN